MRRTAIMLANFVLLLTLGATAQENRSEISVQGTGFFTQDTSGRGVSRTTTDTGGFLVDTVIISTAGSLAKRTTATTEIPRSIFLQADSRELRRRCTQPLPMWW